MAASNANVVLSEDVQARGRAVYLDIGVVIGVLGIVLNAPVVLVLGQRGQAHFLSHTVRHIIINQSAVDFMASMILVWTQFHSHKVSSILPTDIGEPQLYCKLVWSTYLLSAGLTASSANLQLLTFERYLSLCHPLTHKRHCTKPVTRCALVGVWIWGFAYQAITTAMFRYDPRHNSYVLHTDNFGLIITFMVCNQPIYYILPILVMLFCYGHVISVLKKRIASESGNPYKVRQAKQSQSFIITCVSLCVVYVACYTPSLVNIAANMISQTRLQTTSLVYNVAVLMIFANIFVNPIVYFIKMRTFRRALLAFVTCYQMDATRARSGLGMSGVVSSSRSEQRIANHVVIQVNTVNPL